MKLRNVFLNLSFLLTSVIASSQKSVEFKVIKENTQKKDIKTLLIAGAGNTTARIFLENLSEKLKKEFKRTGVEADYHFLGTDFKLANDELNEFFKEQKYHAFLIINQSDTIIVDRYTLNRGGNMPRSANSLFLWGSTPSSNVIYDQQFSFRMFENNQQVSFWDASLNVYFDLLKKSVYGNISDKIITSLSQNKFF